MVEPGVLTAEVVDFDGKDVPVTSSENPELAVVRPPPAVPACVFM